MQVLRRPERRRTVRVSLQIPLVVRCHTREGDIVDWKACTDSVSAHGALLYLEAPVHPGEPLRLLNDWTRESVDCLVTCVRESKDGRRIVGVGFASNRVNFWHMAFPRPGTRQAVRSARTGALATSME